MMLIVLADNGFVAKKTVESKSYQRFVVILSLFSFVVC